MHASSLSMECLRAQLQSRSGSCLVTPGRHVTASQHTNTPTCAPPCSQPIACARSLGCCVRSGQRQLNSSQTTAASVSPSQRSAHLSGGSSTAGLGTGISRGKGLVQGAAGCTLTCSSSSKGQVSAHAQTSCSAQAGMWRDWQIPLSFRAGSSRGRQVQQMPCVRQQAAHQAGHQQQAGRGQHAWWLAGQTVASLQGKVVGRL